MSYLTLIGTVTLIHVLALMSPGPDFIMCIRNSLTYSRKTGIWTAVGFGLGMTVHILYCLAGLAVIISQSIVAFNMIKFLGAAYLISIGIKSFRAKAEPMEIGMATKKVDIAPLAAMKIGFLTNVLNPKASLFMLSLFTIVIAPETPAPIMVILGAIMIASTILWFSLVATAMTQQKIRDIFQRSQNAFTKTFGGLLIVLGIKVALSKR